MASASVIRAAVSSKILNKVDRFFSNRLTKPFSWSLSRTPAAPAPP